MRDLIVYTGGTFDLFHQGHLNLLRNCASMGDVVVSLNTDEFVIEYKKKKPVQSLEVRLDVLRACKFVSWVVINTGGKNSRIAIECVKPNIIAVGSDWAPPRNYLSQLSIDEQFLREKNIELLFFPYTQGISSSLIRQSL